MPDPLVHAAAWIALGSAIGALAVTVWFAWGAWREWRRLQVVRQAATALVDVHVDRLDESIARAGERAGSTADHGEQLAASLAELRTDVSHLKWLLTKVPDERARLRRVIGDLLLPTDDRKGGGDGGR